MLAKREITDIDACRSNIRTLVRNRSVTATRTVFSHESLLLLDAIDLTVILSLPNNLE
jgi:hypothetical protein